MNIAGLLGGMVAPVTEWVKGRQERVRIEAEARARVEQTMAEVAQQDAQFAAQWALVKAKNENSTWKDEFALLVMALPMIVLMVAGAATVFGASVDVRALAVAMFEPLSQVPDWWSRTFQVAIWTALGVNYSKKLIGK